MSSAQNRPTGRQARTGNTGMGDPRSAGAHSAGYQEGYPSETVESGTQGYPSESAQYGRSGQYETTQYGREGRRVSTGAYPETGQYGQGGLAEEHRHLHLPGALATLTGLLTFFMGMVSILKRLFFASVTQYPFTYSPRSRGTTELIIGAVLTLLGVCLLLGMHWARALTIVVATLAAIFNFMFLPYYPFWSIVLLALDVLIIWALLRHHGQQQRQWG